MSNKTEKFWFVFRKQQLLWTDKMEILKADHQFIKHGKFLRQLPLDYTDASHVVAEVAEDVIFPEEMQLKNIRELYLLLPPHMMVLANKASQLLEWDRSHQFCGECGSRTHANKNEHSRICENISCQRIFFPKISPVIIVAVEREQEILLARSPHFPAEIYSVLAGFIEPGETVEEAIHREVYEEVGIKIKNLRYFASQSWPFPNSLMLGFRADYESGEVICGPNEIEDAAFFHIDALPKTFPGSISISQWLLQDFCKRHKRNK